MANDRRGWRLGLGPVFTFEWLARSRQWQWYALRSLFAGAFLVALFVILGQTQTGHAGTTIQQLAALGENFFVAVIGTQLTLVLLAAPAATAGAICQDRASGMMLHVLVTDLSNAEIVLGKLSARLTTVVGLVTCAWPILALLTLLGGVDPVALTGAFLVTLGVALLGCALAFCFSLWSRKTHEALLGTYAVWGLWLVGKSFLKLVDRGYGTSLTLPTFLANPYELAFAPYWTPATASLSDSITFLIATTGLATVLTLVAIGRLRTVCTRTSAVAGARRLARPRRFGRLIKLPRLWRRPPLDFNPVYWRECHRSQPSRLAGFVVGLYAVGAAVASVAAILAPRLTFAMAWVNGLQVAIGMLLLSVMAATSLTEERVRGSLDVLLATPLSTPAIVLGKWLGTFRYVPYLAIGPVLVTIGGGWSEPDLVATTFLTLSFVLVCGAAIISLGLFLATWIVRPGRAVTLTVTAYVLVAVLPLVLGGFLRGPENALFMMSSPFFYAGELAADLCGNRQTHLTEAVVWTVVYLVAACLLLATTLGIFNRSLGRPYARTRPDGWRSSRPNALRRLPGTSAGPRVGSAGSGPSG